MFAAVIPIRASKCAPVQHFINILGGVFLGIRLCGGHGVCHQSSEKSDGNGTLLAFPGSMCGAFLCGMLYKYGKHLPFAYAGELFRTSVIGGLLSYPVATLIMGSEAQYSALSFHSSYPAAAVRSLRPYW